MFYGLVFSAALLSVMFPATGWGDELRLFPSFGLREEYNGNILFSANGRDLKKDFVTTVSPGLKIAHSTGRIAGSLAARLDHTRYIDEHKLNSTDQSYRGKLDCSITPRSKLSIETDYVKDSLPDRDIKTTGIVLSVTPRHSVRSAFSLDYRLTEKMAAVGSYDFSRNQFDNKRELDDTSQEITAGLVNDFGSYVPLLTGRVDWGYSDYLASGSRISSARGRIGFSLDINEFWSVLINGGFRRTWSKVFITRLEPLLDLTPGVPVQIGIRSVGEEVKKGGWGWTGVASLNYRGERGSGSFSFNRDVQPAVGLGGSAERNSLTVSIRYKGTYGAAFLFTGDYFINRSGVSEFAAREIDRRSFNIRPGVSYAFSREMAVDAFYEFMEDNNRVLNLKAGRHLFSVRFHILYDFFM